MSAGGLLAFRVIFIFSSFFFFFFFACVAVAAAASRLFSRRAVTLSAESSDRWNTINTITTAACTAQPAPSFPPPTHPPRRPIKFAVVGSIFQTEPLLAVGAIFETTGGILEPLLGAQRKSTFFSVWPRISFFARCFHRLCSNHVHKNLTGGDKLVEP